MSQQVPQRQVPRWLEMAVVLSLLSIHWLLGVWGIVNKSPTQDEPLHMASGYAYWMFDDYRMQPENGNLPQRLAAFPLLWLDAAYVDLDTADWRQARQFHVSSDFLYHADNAALWMLFLARCVMMTASVLLCLCVFLWARKLWGPGGDFIALVLAVFSIELLAHGPLATSDAVFALTTLLFLAALWRFLHGVGVKSVLMLGLAAGLSAVSKFSVVILLPVSMVLLGLRLANKDPLPHAFQGAGKSRSVPRLPGKLMLLGSGALAAVLIAWVVVWGFYGFRYQAFSGELEEGTFYRDPMAQIEEDSALGAFFEFAGEYRLLPEAYLHGALYTYAHSLERNAYFLGEKGTGGWRWFFPVAFLVKVPIPLILCMICGFALFIISTFSRIRGGHWHQLWGLFYRTAPLWVFFVAYWAGAISGNLNIGFRHMLPVFPVLFILLGGLALTLRRKPIVASLIIGGLLAGYVVDAIRIYPHYLAYFNHLAGGPDQGHYFLVDSSLDWGQDIPGLAAWQQQRLAEPEADGMYLALFTVADRRYHGVRGIDLFGYGGKYGDMELPVLDGGIYAVSATLLMGPYFHVSEPWTGAHENFYHELYDKVYEVARASGGDPRKLGSIMAAEPETDWGRLFSHAVHFRMEKLRYFLLGQEPVDKIGHSIFIYDLSRDELEAAELHPQAGFPPEFHLREAFMHKSKVHGSRGDASPCVNEAAHPDAPAEFGE